MQREASSVRLLATNALIETALTLADVRRWITIIPVYRKLRDSFAYFAGRTLVVCKELNGLIDWLE